MAYQSKNLFTNEISKLATREDYQDVIQRMDSLKAKNRESELKKFSDDFGLNSEKILKNVKNLLSDALNPNEIKEELETNAAQYKGYYEKYKKESFHNAEKILESALNYISKITKYYEARIEAVLLSNPGIEERSPAHVKSYLLGEDNTIQSDKQVELEVAPIHLDKHEQFVNRLTSILEQNMEEEKQTEEIESLFRSTFDFGRMSWMSFYKELGLDEKYIKRIRGVQGKIIKLLIIAKKNPEDESVKKDLQKAIDSFLNPVFQTPGEQDKSLGGVNVVGSIPLSEKDANKNRFKTPEIHKEVMQEITTDPLELVGKSMNLDIFLGACKLTNYDEVLEYVKTEDPLPARYCSHNANFKGKDSDKINMHFLTIGQEDKGDGNTPLINVSIVAPKNVTFTEGSVYKVKLKAIGDYKEAGRKQSRWVRGELIEDLPEILGSGNFIGSAKGAKILQSMG